MPVRPPPGCLSSQHICVFADTTAEVGTIAGIASAVVMALVGAVTSYISYQKKKLCFSLQRESFYSVTGQLHYPRWKPR